MTARWNPPHGKRLCICKSLQCKYMRKFQDRRIQPLCHLSVVDGGFIPTKLSLVKPARGTRLILGALVSQSPQHPSTGCSCRNMFQSMPAHHTAPVPCQNETISGFTTGSSPVTF